MLRYCCRPNRVLRPFCSVQVRLHSSRQTPQLGAHFDERLCKMIDFNPGPTTTEGDEWLTAEEVAALFKIPKKTIYAYRKDGRLRGHYPFDGRHLRFRRSELPGGS